MLKNSLKEVNFKIRDKQNFYLKVLPKTNPIAKLKAIKYKNAKIAESKESLSVFLLSEK
jgi:hypothetical protein